MPRYGEGLRVRVRWCRNIVDSKECGKLYNTTSKYGRVCHSCMAINLTKASCKRISHYILKGGTWVWKEKIQNLKIRKPSKREFTQTWGLVIKGFH